MNQTRSSMTPAKSSSRAHRLPRSQYMQDSGPDYDSEEEDYSSLVPVPSSEFYDRFEKIRKANIELTKDGPIKVGKKSQNSKVRFRDDISYDDDANSDDEDSFADGKSTPTKVLLVTVPTVYSQESEEVGSECSDSEEPADTPSNTVSFREEVEEEDGTVLGWETHLEEELEDESNSSRQESSTETVILCRSETEESTELTEWFSRSINLDEAEDEARKESAEEEVMDLLKLLADDGKESRQRPGTAFSVKVRRKRVQEEKAVDKEVRPSTAPARRQCCVRGFPAKLPKYNGLRSEYGLSAEQLQLRERRKMDLANALKTEKEQRYLEHKMKRKENEITFNNWLIQKKREAEAKAIRRFRQSNYCFRTIPAPTSHLALKLS